MKRALVLLVLTAGSACDKSGPLADLDAEATWKVVPAASSAPPVAASAPAVRDAGRLMPPRPVPTSSPTVTITMPQEVQLQAIQYMAAMQAPRPGDAPADPDYAKALADSLRGMGRPDVISSGRLVDVRLEKGCDASLPKQAIARSAGSTPGALLAHGVLVVRCTDHKVQCLQSTRDVDDVICVHK